jgi:dihydrofolate reductase
LSPDVLEPRCLIAFPHRDTATRLRTSLKRALTRPDGPTALLPRRAAVVSAGFGTADAMLMGRVQYDAWAAYWPEHADEPFGDVMNSMKKYVISNSLQTAQWHNSEIINGDVARKLTDIKAQDGGDIAMSGSAITVRWLLHAGLLDELNLLVHPLTVGDGLARLFSLDESSVPLELLSAQPFKSGMLNLSYGRAKD